MHGSTQLQRSTKIPHASLAGPRGKKEQINAAATTRIIRLITVATIFVACFSLVTLVRTLALGNLGRLPITNTPSQVEQASCITFLGDTMFANLGMDYSAEHLNESSHSFNNIRSLMNKCSVVIANLEGPITKLGRDADPLRKAAAYSFNMDPDIVPQLLLDEGITHVNRANNHLLDRGEDGVADTDQHLKQARISYFGCGQNTSKAASPLILRLNGIMVGVTGYSEMYGRGILPNASRSRTGVLPVNWEYAALGRKLLDEHSVDLRIAFVHWGDNYGQVTSKMRDRANILADEGLYDVIIGSDGSHTVQEFDFAGKKRKIPVLYNIGNFIFQTPGRFGKMSALPYGTVVHVTLNVKTRRFESIMLHCIYVDNRIVKFQPRKCTPAQAEELFRSMGEYISYGHNNTFAIIDLKKY